MVCGHNEPNAAQWECLYATLSYFIDKTYFSFCSSLINPVTSLHTINDTENSYVSHD